MGQESVEGRNVKDLVLRLREHGSEEAPGVGRGLRSLGSLSRFLSRGVTDPGTPDSQRQTGTPRSSEPALGPLLRTTVLESSPHTPYGRGPPQERGPHPVLCACPERPLCSAEEASGGGPGPPRLLRTWVRLPPGSAGRAVRSDRVRQRVGQLRIVHQFL